MATPYFQLRLQSAPSTQDVARESLASVPILVIAAQQTEGRGRSGSTWLTADRALAASLAIQVAPGEDRPISLMAAVAGARLGVGIDLKWPNDLLKEGVKVGGILVERSGEMVIIGLGLNLWWPEAPDGMGALYPDDPGEGRHLELGAVWGAETMHLFEDRGWPRDEYLERCTTLGREINWEPDGEGTVLDVDESGALIVESGGERITVRSGEVHHLRARP